MATYSRRSFIVATGLTGLGAISPNLLLGSSRQSPAAGIPLIIDADTANEVDDLYAIVVGLLIPELDVRGITSAQWHTQEFAPADTVGASQQLNEEILSLMGKSEVPHLRGSNIPMVNTHRHQPSAAATFIVEQALRMPEGEKLQVVILGPATNLASAVLMEPAIIPRVTANYLGFWHHPATGTWSKREFNTGNDPNAVDLLIDTPGLEFRVMTASTSRHLVFDKAIVDSHLKGKAGIGDYLVERWESYDRFWQETDREKAHWIMWDVAIVMALAYPEMATLSSVQSPHDNRDRIIQAYTSINVEAMKERYWQILDAFVG